MTLRSDKWRASKSMNLIFKIMQVHHGIFLTFLSTTALNEGIKEVLQNIQNKAPQDSQYLVKESAVRGLKKSYLRWILNRHPLSEISNAPGYVYNQKYSIYSSEVVESPYSLVILNNLANFKKGKLFSTKELSLSLTYTPKESCLAQSTKFGVPVHLHRSFLVINQKHICKLWSKLP